MEDLMRPPYRATPSIAWKY